MADIIVLALVIGYCAFVIINRHKKNKKAKASGGCCGSCCGCSGCSSCSNPYYENIYK
ncbi:FeoB-associated Cys-rich membrane protein [Anaerofustis sp.]|uniref:FeoB-associated Cys-rich membrane protein n=1 Tax=Anaerofustis sp. TaxID=1872517 RepID=UPI0025C5B579|nr:FeoB-associated Cys-rich membrane protein [Anaerofustis sp.]